MLTTLFRLPRRRRRALPFTAVHQFHSGTRVGDAVTNELLELRRVLRRSGFASEVFAEHIEPDLRSEVRRLSDYRSDERAVLLVHHSMGFDSFRQVVALPDRKILRYHNITPPEYLSHPHLRSYAEKGRRQLREYRAHVEYALADSEYNRRELAQLGYKYSAVLPICFDAAAFRATPTDPAALQVGAGRHTLLFVGRISRNKCQTDLVRIFARCRQRDARLRLVLVGSWEQGDDYVDEVRAEIRACGLDEDVHLTGHVSAATLAAYYRSSAVFVCASEHEGFGVPLLEAMASDLPIVAFRAAAIPDTLGDAGILLDDKDPEHWAETIRRLCSDPAERAQILDTQRRRLADLSVERTSAGLHALLDALGAARTPLENMRPTLQIQGPFETAYSLAIVNRRLAEALDAEGTFDVSIYCTEGPGDYSPDARALADNPHAAWLWRKSALLTAQPDVVIRNLYPPRVADSPGRVNYLHFYWEDSRIPAQWADDFNRWLDGILAPSRHVERALRDSGVTVPIHILPPGGGDPPSVAPAAPPAPCLTKSFRFLNIGSGFPRKGIDILLTAYFAEFSGDDDVCLVIKTFPNIHNTVAAQLDEWKARTPNPPACVHIDRDVSPAELEGLYGAAHCLVHPARAEGFGLPIAEAMARRIPVIATAYGGHMDFCNDATAWLLDYRLVPSGSHLAVEGSEWAEPDPAHLRTLMRMIASGGEADNVRRKVETAWQMVTSTLQWSAAAARCATLIAPSPVRGTVRDGLKLAMVTSWNSRCGIAEYSRYLLEALARAHPAVRPVVLSSAPEGAWRTPPVPSHHCWDPPPIGDLQALAGYVDALGVEVVHFQHNFGFFALPEFGASVASLRAARKKVVITLHRTADLVRDGPVISLGAIAPALRQANALVVHSLVDVERLHAFGLRDNVHVIAHGSVLAPAFDRSVRQSWGLAFEPLIGTFGFLLPHKGLLELLAAIALLRERHPSIGLLAQCALHRDRLSRDFEPTVRQRIADLHLEDRVLLSTEFLEPDEATLFLQLADVIALPYKDTAESTSAAVRFALATGRPVLTTGEAIFGDVASATYPIAACAPELIASAIDAVLGDSELAEKLALRSQALARATSWAAVGDQYYDLLDALV